MSSLYPFQFEALHLKLTVERLESIMAELTPTQCQFTIPTAISPVSVSPYNFHTSVFGTGPPGYGLPSLYTNPTIGPYDQAKGSQVDMDKLRSPLIKAYHAPGCSQSILSYAQGGAGPSVIIDLCDNDSSTSSNVDSEPTDALTATVFLKVLNPHNKKQVLQKRRRFLQIAKQNKWQR